MKSSYTRLAGTSNLMVIIALAGLVAFGWLLYASFQDQQIEVADSTSPNQAEYLKTRAELEAEANPDAVTTPAESADEPAPTAVVEPSVPTSGEYVTYDKAALTSGTNVIFFHATWCPTCRALETDITRNLTDLPDDVTIFKADYDSETELKQQYGVVRQHTLVVVDQNGNQIRTLTGLSNTLEQVLSQL